MHATTSLAPAVAPFSIPSFKLLLQEPDLVRGRVPRGRVRPFGVALRYLWSVPVLPALLDQRDVEHVSRREELLRDFRYC